MKIDSNDYRVEPGKKVKLDEWPTAGKAVAKSKAEYQKLLEKHVNELSKLQELHYASNKKGRSRQQRPSEIDTRLATGAEQANVENSARK